MEKEAVKRKINKLWKAGKKDLDKILKNTGDLISKGEVYLKDVSGKTEEKLERMNLLLRREKLYYELGKSVAKSPKNNWASNKKIEGLSAKVKQLSRNIKKLK